MVFCPSSYRPYSSYAVSSNGIFELARMFREYKCTFMACERPEVLVYRTEYLYTEDNSHMMETFIGKVVLPLSLTNMEVEVYENVGGEA